MVLAPSSSDTSQTLAAYMAAMGEDQLFARVTITWANGEKRTVRMLLDTGAELDIIDARFVPEDVLRGAARREYNLVGMGGTTVAPIGVVGGNAQFLLEKEKLSPSTSLSFQVLKNSDLYEGVLGKVGLKKMRVGVDLFRDEVWQWGEDEETKSFIPLTTRTRGNTRDQRKANPGTQKDEDSSKKSRNKHNKSPK